MKIFLNDLYRIAYATDASSYREIPGAVAFPETEKDVYELVMKARREGTCLIPRAGGTSLAGQVVGNGIVVDVSRYLNKILEINPEERWARVQPGVIRDELNAALRPYGLFFSPETSTSNRCCIGGMVGNNSCGAHSLIYGSTRHHILQLKGYLSDGSYFDTSVRGGSMQEKCIYAQLDEWKSDSAVRAMLSENYPDRSLRRRSCGYAIDEAIEGPEVDLCKIICGSEGTLCFVTEIKVGLDPLPPEEKMVLCIHCDSLEKSFLTNLVALKHGPSAVELMDGKVLELAKGNPAAARNRFFVEGDPAALVIAEFVRREDGCSSGDGNLFSAGGQNGGPAGSSSGSMAGTAAFDVAAYDGKWHCAEADELERELLEQGLAYCCTRVYGREVGRVWELRKAGLGILGGMKGDAKPVGVIEDTAVAPSRLPEYMKDFREMMSRLGLDCVYHGHIGTGELHLRPVLNLKTEEGRRKFREVAEETALLVRKHKGSLSGEHGDGRLRGEFIPLMYGRECYEMMRAVKKCWDPDGVFNVGKIVDTPKMDEGLRYGVGEPYMIERALRTRATYYNWAAGLCGSGGSAGLCNSGDKGGSAGFGDIGDVDCSGGSAGLCNSDDKGGSAGFGDIGHNRRDGMAGKSQVQAMMCAVEQCNGSADCRKIVGGTLCPAYKVSDRDELQSTRARANLLREILTRGIGGKVLEAPELREVLESCLACKGCKGECPANVDMTRLRSEILQQIYDREGTPRRSWMVARMASFEKLGSYFAPFYNFFAGWDLSASLIKRFVGFAPEREIPRVSGRRTIAEALAGAGGPAGSSAAGSTGKFAAGSNGSQTNPASFSAESSRMFVANGPGRRKVYLFVDEFTKYQEPELAGKLIQLLEKLGYEVLVPKHVESGRAAISKGCLGLARKYAEKNVRLLKDIVNEDVPLIGIEPSCILSFRDEYPDLVASELRSEAMRLGRNCLLYDEFIMREAAAGRIFPSAFRDDACEIWLHGHCHQKALVGIERTAEMLQLPQGVKVNVIPSGCCGMAGSFGYEKEHYRESLAIGEMVLFPAVRKAMGNAPTDAVVRFVAAPGTSCRQQIYDGTGIRAVHPIEILHYLAR